MLSLTEHHVAFVHRVVEDSGFPADVVPLTDADYDKSVVDMLHSHPAPHLPTWLFAYGSLIWKPEIDYASEEIGLARGWHRAFCFHIPRFRGTPDNPGLMMALDRGGQCRGVLFRLPDRDLAGQLDKLFRQEFRARPQNNLPRWIKVETASGPVNALAFIMNRASPYYAGRLPLHAVADILARACGHGGSGAEYLFNTVSHLEARGIRDVDLWRLQHLVAARIELMMKAAAESGSSVPRSEIGIGGRMHC